MLSVLADRLDEDLLEGGLDQLEAADAGTFRSRAQQLLSIRTRPQPDLRIVSIAIKGFDERAAFKAGIALILHLDRVLAVARLDLLQVAFQHAAPVVNEADRVTQPLDLVHAMGGEKNRLSSSAQLKQYILQDGCVGGIQPGKWLIHDYQGGFVQQHGDELNLLLHSFGELFHLLPGPVAQLQSVAPIYRPLLR